MSVATEGNVTRLPLRSRKSNDPPLFSVMTEKEIRQRAAGDEDMLVKGLIPSEGFGICTARPRRSRASSPSISAIASPTVSLGPAVASNGAPRRMSRLRGRRAYQGASKAFEQRFAWTTRPSI